MSRPQAIKLEEPMRIQNLCAGIVVAMLAVAVLTLSAQAPAQLRPPQTFPAYLQGQYATLKRNITGSAEKMPAEHFAFKPVPEVMSYAEVLTHIVETQYGYCSTVKGGANPGTSLTSRSPTRPSSVSW